MYSFYFVYFKINYWIHSCKLIFPAYYYIYDLFFFTLVRNWLIRIIWICLVYTHTRTHNRLYAHTINILVNFYSAAECSDLVWTLIYMHQKMITSTDWTGENYILMRSQVRFYFCSSTNLITILMNWSSDCSHMTNLLIVHCALVFALMSTVQPL